MNAFLRFWIICVVALGHAVLRVSELDVIMETCHTRRALF